MRRVKRPPARLRLPEDKIRDPNGDVYPWKSEKNTLNEFRRSLRAWLLRRQKYRCTYCWMPIGKSAHRSVHLDHFVPKNTGSGEPEWTYEILNLILSCEYCNMRVKRDYNPLSAKVGSYRRSSFRIFHPYLDSIFDHIEGGYLGGCHEPTVPRGLTDKGQETIRLFKLASPATQIRWDQEYQNAVAARVMERLEQEDPDWHAKLMKEIS